MLYTLDKLTGKRIKTKDVDEWYRWIKSDESIILRHTCAEAVFTLRFIGFNAGSKQNPIWFSTCVTAPETDLYSDIPSKSVGFTTFNQATERHREYFYGCRKHIEAKLNQTASNT